MTATIRMDASGPVKALGNLVKNLPKELKIVSKKTAKKGKSIIAKQVAGEIAVTQSNVKKLLTVRDAGKTGAEVALKKTARIPLHQFRARQTKAGVTYKIDKTGGRKLIPGAFIPRKGGPVFKRKGKSRLPIYKRYGPSPWGVFRNSRFKWPAKQQMQAELRKQMTERIRYRKLKKSGAI